MDPFGRAMHGGAERACSERDTYASCGPFRGATAASVVFRCLCRMSQGRNGNVKMTWQECYAIFRRFETAAAVKPYCLDLISIQFG